MRRYLGRTLLLRISVKCCDESLVLATDIFLAHSTLPRDKQRPMKARVCDVLVASAAQ